MGANRLIRLGCRAIMVRSPPGDRSFERPPIKMPAAVVDSRHGNSRQAINSLRFSDPCLRGISAGSTQESVWALQCGGYGLALHADGQR